MKRRKKRFYINIDNVNKIVFFSLFSITDLRVFLTLIGAIAAFLREILIKLIMIRIEFAKNDEINFDLSILFYELGFYEKLRISVCEFDVYKTYN